MFVLLLFFFFNDTATTEIYTLSLHDALPIWPTSAWSARRPRPDRRRGPSALLAVVDRREAPAELVDEDRESTRLNSSHANISYAVFFLKKKKNHRYLGFDRSRICRTS